MLTVGYPLSLITAITITKHLIIVHSTTVYLTPQLSTFPLLTHSVSLTELVYCVDNVNKTSVPYLVSFNVSVAPT